MSVTFHTKNRKRSRVHGFLKRMSTTSGRKIINNRRRKKKSRLSVKVNF